VSAEINLIEVRMGKQESTPSKALFRDNSLIIEAVPVGKEYLSLPLDSFETKLGRSMKQQEMPLIISSIIFFFFSLLARFVHTNDPLLKNIYVFFFFIYFLGFFIVFPWIGFIVGFTWVFLLLAFIKNRELILLTKIGEIRISGDKHILKNLETEINRRKSGEHRSN
jgi:hypothetical protein